MIVKNACRAFVECSLTNQLKTNAESMKTAGATFVAAFFGMVAMLAASFRRREDEYSSLSVA